MSFRDDVIRDAYQAVAAVLKILEHKPSCFLPNPQAAINWLTLHGVREWLEQLAESLAQAQASLKSTVSVTSDNVALPQFIGSLENHARTVKQVFSNVEAVKVWGSIVQTEILIADQSEVRPEFSTRVPFRLQKPNPLCL